MSDPRLPVVFTRAQALTLGLTDHAITWRVRTGRWRSLRRGVFTLTSTWEGSSAEGRHLLSALGIAVAKAQPPALSHLTAALAYGWPAPMDVDPTPWVTIAPEEREPTRRRHHHVQQVAPLPGHHTVTRQGVNLTSPARTVADCLRHYPAETSVPIADAALASGVDPDAVAAILRWQAGWPYAARGLRSSELVDGRREGWLESRSMVAVHRLSLPPPQPQVTILDRHGGFVARVDFLWVDQGVIGEADGWAKYEIASSRQPSSNGPQLVVPMANLRSEKLREDALRSLGYEIARWTTSDMLGSARPLAATLAAAFARADPTRVAGGRRFASWPATGAEILTPGLDQLSRGGSSGLLLSPPYSLNRGDQAS